MKYLQKIYGLVLKIIQICYMYFDDARILKQESAMDVFYDSLFKQKSTSENLPIEAMHINRSLDTIEALPLIPELYEPKISVVIPHFNQWSYLREALKELQNQTVMPDEIIVVDDQSDIGSHNLLRQIIEESDRVVKTILLEPKEKLYAGRARQFGAEAASGNIVVMHDADDVSHFQRIEFTKMLFVSNSDLYQLNIGLIEFSNNYYPVVRKFDFNEVDNQLKTPLEIKERMRKVFTSQLFSTVKHSGIRFGDYSIGNFGASAGHVAYRKELVSFVKWRGPHNPYFTKYEDFDFNLILFLAMKGKNSYSLDLPLLSYRRGTTTNRVHY